jgi:hypothetical protein
MYIINFFIQPKKLSLYAVCVTFTFRFHNRNSWEELLGLHRDILKGSLQYVQCLVFDCA